MIHTDAPPARSTEADEYDARWRDSAEGRSNYSAASIGYTPHFLRFMDAGLAAVRAAGGRERVRALEVGCGDGFFTGQLADRGCEATGIDLSPVGVEAARRQYPGATFRVHDLTRPLPFDDASFDFVWCSEVLEHLFAPLAVLEEVRRVLRPGGRLHATVPYHGLLKNVGIALLAFESHYDPTYPHIRFFTKKSLGRLAERAGLAVESIGSCGSNLGWRDRVVKTNILLAARPAG